MSEKRANRNADGQFTSSMRDIGVDLSKYDLGNTSDVFKLIAEVVKGCLEGRISPRQAGAANNSLRILLTFHADIAQAEAHKQQLEKFQAEIADLRKRIEMKETGT